MDAATLKAAGFSDADITQYEGLVSAGFSDQEVQDYYASQAQKPAPAAKPGLMDELRKRASNIAEEWTAQPSKYEPGTLEGPVESFTKSGQRYLRTAGQIAGGVGDAVGAGVKALYNNLMPDSAQAAIKSGLKDIANTDIGRMGISAAKSGYDAYQTFKKAYPEEAKDLEAVVNIASLLPIGKGAQIAGKVAAPVAEKTIVPLARGVKNVAKELEGVYTGGGAGFIEEMSRGSKAAEKAMRGEISGEEIVEHAKTGLKKVADARNEAYVSKLDTIKADPAKLNDVKIGLESKLENLSKPDAFDVGINIDEAGKPVVDFSKSTIVEHQKVIERAIDDVISWDDTTAKGLDVLKKRLSTYIDQTGHRSPANSFLTQLRSNLDSGIKEAVPGYEEMTRGYREVTGLIKDLESNLMLAKKDGSSYAADQTLRRLTSAFRENFEMRKDLLHVLGNESGMDIPGEVSGYIAKQWVPRGLIGKMSAGGTIGAMVYLNPTIWPLLAASSPA